jgi:hypothetical protein
VTLKASWLLGWFASVGQLSAARAAGHSGPEEAADLPLQRAAAGRPPEPELSQTPALEVQGFPETLDGVLGVTPLAQNSLVCTCYTIDHRQVSNLVRENLRGGVRVRAVADGMVLKSETAKSEKAFFRTLFADPPRTLSLEFCWAPRYRIPKKGAGGTVKGFGPQLHAKCGVVDDLHFWSACLNLTNSPETIYDLRSRNFWAASAEYFE